MSPFGLIIFYLYQDNTFKEKVYNNIIDYFKNFFFTKGASPGKENIIGT